MKNKFNISDIDVKFGGDHEPKDEELIQLLKSAYIGKLLVRIALVKAEGIRPFSDFKPNISDDYRKYFEETEKQGTPPPLYVYPKDGYFIMSDDYNAYYLYIEKGYAKIMCTVLGEPEGSFVIEKSDPFQLPAPTAVDISK